MWPFSLYNVHMADLTGVNDTLPVRLGGVSTTSGLPDNYADVTTSGQLLVKDASDGPVTPGTVASFSQLAGGQYNSTAPTLTTGQQAALQVDSSARLIVNVGSTAPPNNIIATGTLTGTGQTVNLTLQGTASVNIDVSGSGFVGTIVVLENTPSSARVLGVLNVNASAIASSITANGNYRVVGLATTSTITVQFSSYTSGSATINIYGSTAPFIMMPYSANAANVLVTSYLNDGSGNSINSYNSQLDVADIVNAALSSGNITVGTTSVAANVSGTNLTNRKLLMVTPTNGTIYFGSSSAVTTANGTPIYQGQTRSFSFSSNVTLYLVAASSIVVNVFEGS